MPQRSSTAFDYLERINRAVDHLYTHLAEAPSLAQLAKIAAFSPFTFTESFAASPANPSLAFRRGFESSAPRCCSAGPTAAAG